MNVIFITIDSLRYDSSGPLKSLFPQAVVFNNAISQSSYTTSSFASIFTSRYPSRLEHTNLVENVQGASVKSQTTLAQVLRAGGYTTCGIHSNPLLSRLFGFEKGFEFFEDSLLYNSFLPELMKLRINKIVRLLKVRAYQPAEVITEKALTWLNKHPTSTFFLWLHYMDCHGPYIPEKGFKLLNKIAAEKLWRKAIKKPYDVSSEEIASLKAAYRDEINYIATSLKRLQDELSEMGIWDDALVILTADHGDEFGEHGAFTHHHKLYDELIHVPLIMKLPTSEQKIGAVDRQVGLIHLTPTILDYAGVNIAELDFEGNSLLPLIRDRDGTDVHLPDHLYSEADWVPDFNGCVRTQQWKLIKNDIEQRSELYNLKIDPAERSNLVDDDPAILEQLKNLLNRHVCSSQTSSLSHAPASDKMDAQVRDRLKTLGYMD